MSSISDKLTQLAAVKIDLRTAINGKGGSLDDSTPLVDYSAAVEQLNTNGGDSQPYVVPSQNDGATLTLMNRITQWPSGFVLDTSGTKNLNNLFYGYSLMENTPLIDASSTNTLANMFFGCSNLETANITNTASVKTVSSMFRGAKNYFKVAPLFDTSNCTDFGQMFYQDYALTKVPAYNMSKMTNASGMFNQCKNLTQCDVFGFTASIDFSGCVLLTADELNKIFTNAGMAKNTSQTITVTGCAGADTCDKSIALAKGWTVN